MTGSSDLCLPFCRAAADALPGLQTWSVPVTGPSDLCLPVGQRKRSAAGQFRGNANMGADNKRLRLLCWHPCPSAGRRLTPCPAYKTRSVPVTGPSDLRLPFCRAVADALPGLQNQVCAGDRTFRPAPALLPGGG